MLKQKVKLWLNRFINKFYKKNSHRTYCSSSPRKLIRIKKLKLCACMTISQIECIWLKWLMCNQHSIVVAQRYDLWSCYTLCFLCVQGDVGIDIPSTYKYHSSRGWLY